MPIRRSVILAASAAVTTLVLTGCGAPAASDPKVDGVQIVATTTQLGDLTRQVAGDAANVTQLLQPNTSAHSFDPSPADLLALGGAQVLVMNGGGLESWLDGAVDASGFDGAIITAEASVSANAPADHEAEHGDHDPTDAHADDGEDHDGHDHAEDHAEDHSDHDHGGVDPHFWTSIRNSIEIVDAIAEGLAEADPANAVAFRANATDYVDRLQTLDQWATAQFDRVPTDQRLLVSNHNSLGWFNADYDITFVGAVFPSFDDNAELAAGDMNALIERIRESGAPAVFAEASLSPDAARTIAKEAGVRVLAGDEALFIDSLAPSGPAATYIGAQVHNVTMIMRGFGVEAEPAPSEL